MPSTGFYEPFRRGFNRLVDRHATEQNAATSVAAGAASGIVGGERKCSLLDMSLP